MTDEATRASPSNSQMPLEAMRDDETPRIMSLTPDICYVIHGSQRVPTPYNIYAVAGEDARTAPTVRFKGKRAFTLRSLTTTCHGDKPGTGKGIVSGTIEGECEPMSGSSSVRVEGAQVVRHGDMFYMNKRNTVGKAKYIQDTNVYSTPKTYNTKLDKSK